LFDFFHARDASIATVVALELEIDGLTPEWTNGVSPPAKQAAAGSSLRKPWWARPAAPRMELY